MIVNSASPLPDATAPTTADELLTRPATRRLNQRRAAFGKREPGQRLTRRDGIAGIGQNFGHAQSLTLRPHRSLFTRKKNTGDFDDVAEAGLGGLEHGDGGALGASIWRLGRTAGWRREAQKSRYG